MADWGWRWYGFKDDPKGHYTDRQMVRNLMGHIEIASREGRGIRIWAKRGAIHIQHDNDQEWGFVRRTT